MPQDRDQPPRGAPSLAERLEGLFEVTRPVAEPTRRWRNSEVVAECRAAGHELSESHLSELRRGLKRNPTIRTVETLAWFFEVTSWYFTDPSGDEVERVLAQRRRQLERDRAARVDLQDAARELQDALRRSGVTKIGHRGVGGSADPRKQAAAMRALTKLLLDDGAIGEDESAHDAGAAPPPRPPDHSDPV